MCWCYITLVLKKELWDFQHNYNGELVYQLQIMGLD